MPLRVFFNQRDVDLSEFGSLWSYVHKALGNWPSSDRYQWKVYVNTHMEVTCGWCLFNSQKCKPFEKWWGLICVSIRLQQSRVKHYAKCSWTHTTCLDSSYLIFWFVSLPFLYSWFSISPQIYLPHILRCLLLPFAFPVFYSLSLFQYVPSLCWHWEYSLVERILLTLLLPI